MIGHLALPELPFPRSSILDIAPRTRELENKRVTLPVLVAYELGDAAARAEIERIFTTDRPGPFDHRTLQILVTDTGAAAELMAVADTHVRSSLARLHTLPKTPSRDRLERYAELASVRMA